MASPLGGQPQPPLTIVGDAYHFTAEWVAWFSTAHNILRASSSSGPSTARPTTNQYVSMPYFDTTLGKPIWLKTPGGTPVWVDATGAPV